MTSPDIGRNDPCPCGSGRKYRRCCRARDVAAAASSGPYTRTDRDRALARVFRFAAREEFAAEHEFALDLFWADPPPGVSDDEYRAFIDSELGHSVYYPWFAFDFELASGRTLLDTYLGRHGEGLAAGECAYLELMRDSQMRLHEVVDVRLDEGLDLRDLVTGAVVAVRERSATHQLARWDLVAARVIDGKSGVPEIDGLPFVLPPAVKSELGQIVRLGRREQTQRRKQSKAAKSAAKSVATPEARPAGDDATFVRGVFLEALDIWIDQVVFRPMPTLTTADGDSLAFTKAHFDVSDPARLVQLFTGCDDLDADGAGQFVWLEGTGEHRRILGSFRLQGRRLTFEGLSEERAARAQAFVESVAPGCATYRLTKIEDPTQMLANRRQSGVRAERPKRGVGGAGGARGAPSGLPPEVEAQVLHEFYDKHYHEWLDIPLPALSGRTPRHAARLKTQRSRVVELLKMLENHAERDRREGRPVYDTTWMWEALGIERE